ncbi:hypothetical protein [Microbacterium sp. UBA3486]|uniref:hypothetical protein n=1 Tax=Microbacterium TaxID=33882 RepID=UPI0025E7A7F6|nr:MULTISPECIES: hypothetical protein [Microbacterium]
MTPIITEDKFHHGHAQNVAADYFLVVNERLEPLIKRLNAFDVRAGSSLAGDDRATRSDAVSHQARALLSVAADNASTVATVLVKAEVLPAFAAFTLLRNALECAGVALWLIGPRARDSRILRALQLSRESRNDEQRFEATVAGQKYRGLPDTDAVLQRLIVERDQRPGIFGERLTPPPITDRLAEAQSYITQRSDDQEPLLVQWQRTSGLAHGRRHAVWQTSNARIVSLDHIGFQAMMSGDIVAITAHFEAAVNHLDDGISLLELRGS